MNKLTVAGLVVAALVVWNALPGIRAIHDPCHQSLAHAEILSLATAAWQYRRLFGSNREISNSELKDRGFLLKYSITETT